MITREDDLNRSFRNFFLPAMLVDYNLQFLFFLTRDVTLEYGKQHIPAQYLFPQIGSHISPILTFRITSTSYFTSPVRALVERDKESLFLFQFSSKSYLIQVNPEVYQYSIVEMEQRFLRIPVRAPLAFRILHILTRNLVLQFECHHRNSV